MTSEEAHHRALMSLLDVVEELCQGLAHGQTPEVDWAEVVTFTFGHHRRELIDPEGARLDQVEVTHE